MTLKRFALILTLVWAALPAMAAGDTPARIEAAFRDWVAQHDVGQAALAVGKGGKPATSLGIGIAADAPVELASLSKAITGVCVFTLLQDGIWTAKTTSAEVLGQGPKGITVAQLLTHTSGIGPDGTQSIMPGWLGNKRDTAQDVATLALRREQQSGSVGRFFYNNENYAILGVMLEAELGNYEAGCRTRVLAPAGGAADTPSKITHGFLPWGGWRMPVADYAAFLDHWFGLNGPLGQTPTLAPHESVGNGVFYGMGMFHRPKISGFNFWHFGAWCIPGKLMTGSFTVSWEGKWRAVAYYDRCLDWDAMVALDAALVKAVYNP